MRSSTRSTVRGWIAGECWVSRLLCLVCLSISSVALAQSLLNPPPPHISPSQITCFDPADPAPAYNWNVSAFLGSGQVLAAFNPSAGYDVDYNFADTPLPPAAAWNQDTLLPYEEYAGTPPVLIDVPTPLLIPPYCQQVPTPPECTPSAPFLYWQGEATAFGNPFDGTDTIVGRVGYMDPISLTTDPGLPLLGPGSVSSHFVGAATTGWATFPTYQPVGFTKSPLWRYASSSAPQVNGAFAAVTETTGPLEGQAQFPKVAMDYSSGWVYVVDNVPTSCEPGATQRPTPLHVFSGPKGGPCTGMPGAAGCPEQNCWNASGAVQVATGALATCAANQSGARCIPPNLPTDAAVTGFDGRVWVVQLETLGGVTGPTLQMIDPSTGLAEVFSLPFGSGPIGSTSAPVFPMPVPSSSDSSSYVPCPSGAFNCPSVGPGQFQQVPDWTQCLPGCGETGPGNAFGGSSLNCGTSNGLVHGSAIAWRQTPTVSYGYDRASGKTLIYLAGTFVYQGLNGPGPVDSSCPLPTPLNGGNAISRIWFETLEFDQATATTGSTTLALRNFGVTPNCDYNVYMPTLTAHPLIPEVALAFYSDQSCPQGILQGSCFGSNNQGGIAGLYTLACDGNVFECKSWTGGGSASTNATDLFSSCGQILGPKSVPTSFPISPYAVPGQIPGAANYFEPNVMTDYLGSFTELNGAVFWSYLVGTQPIIQTGAPPTATFSSEGCMNAIGEGFDPVISSTDPTCRDKEETTKQGCRSDYVGCLADAGIEAEVDGENESQGEGEVRTSKSGDEDGCGRSEFVECDDRNACFAGPDDLRARGRNEDHGHNGGRGHDFADGGVSLPAAGACRVADCTCLANATAVERSCQRVQQSVDTFVASLGPLPTTIEPVATSTFTPLPAPSLPPGTFGAACATTGDCPQSLGQDCIEGRCTCPPTTVVCGIAGQVLCVDPLSDPHNCGGCGVTCSSGICTNAVCSP